MIFLSVHRLVSVGNKLVCWLLSITLRDTNLKPQPGMSLVFMCVKLGHCSLSGSNREGECL
jgi:hypothetical protein